MNPETQTRTHAELVVDIGPIAHGGHCVARHEGRVVFVRHAIPGEKARIRLTDAGEGSKFWRADVVEVLESSPERVPHFWHLADSLRSWSHGHAPVGGAELGHMSLGHQRSLKAAVLAEQLKRLAGVEHPAVWADPAGRENIVEPVGEAAAGTADAPGLGWRTRASFAVTPGGKLGMHAHRSDQVIPVREMPLAVDGINDLRLWDIDLQGIERVEVAAPANGSRPLVLLAPAAGTRAKRLSAILAQLPPDVSVASFDPAKGEALQLRGRTWVQESAAGHDYRVTGAGFWQIHRDAPGHPRRGSHRTSFTTAGTWNRAPWWPTCTQAPGCSRPRWPTPWASPDPCFPLRAPPEPAGMPGRTCTAQPRWRSCRAGLNASCAKRPATSTHWCSTRPARVQERPWSAS